MFIHTLALILIYFIFESDQVHMSYEEIFIHIKISCVIILIFSFDLHVNNKFSCSIKTAPSPL